MKPAEHYKRIKQLSDCIKKEIETMESEQHIIDAAIFVATGDLEDKIDKLEQAIKQII